MSTSSLRPSAEAFIDAMHLAPDNQEFVRRCISKYTSAPDSFCEIMSKTIFLVREAIKSLFGRSEWQKSVKIFQDRAFEALIARGLEDQSFNTYGEMMLWRCYLAQLGEVPLQYHRMAINLAIDLDLTNYVAGIENPQPRQQFLGERRGYLSTSPVYWDPLPVWE